MTYSRSIVIGSGVGGLVTARVLSNHFDEVVLIEKDAISDLPEIRKGTPQANHFHSILAGGLEILNELFPGFDTELESLGSLVPEPGQFYSYMQEGKSFDVMSYKPEPSPPIPGFPRMHIQSRALLERCIRTRVEAIPNIKLRYGTTVKLPLIRDGRVAGVQIESSDEQIESDLVVDATGKASRTLKWLDALELNRPSESCVNCDFSYTTMFFQPNDPSLFEDVGFFMITPTKGEYTKRGGALIRMENGQWLATVAGRLGDHPPKSVDGFMEFAKTLITPRFHELLMQAEPISKPHHFKFPKNVLRHYEQLSEFPEGLLPIGDAICHYNPIYGQGMSGACRQAMALDRLMKERMQKESGLKEIWKEYFPAMFEEIRAPWLFAALADFSQIGTTGDFPAHEQKSIELVLKVRELADGGNQQALELITSIIGLRKPLSALYEEAALESLGIS